MYPPSSPRLSLLLFSLNLHVSRCAFFFCFLYVSSVCVFLSLPFVFYAFLSSALHVRVPLPYLYVSSSVSVYLLRFIYISSVGVSIFPPWYSYVSCLFYMYVSILGLRLSSALYPCIIRVRLAPALSVCVLVVRFSRYMHASSLDVIVCPVAIVYIYIGVRRVQALHACILILRMSHHAEHDCMCPRRAPQSLRVRIIADRPHAVCVCNIIMHHQLHLLPAPTSLPI